MKAGQEVVITGGKDLDEITHGGQISEEAYERLPHSSRQPGRLLELYLMI